MCAYVLPVYAHECVCVCVCARARVFVREKIEVSNKNLNQMKTYDSICLPEETQLLSCFN